MQRSGQLQFGHKVKKIEHWSGGTPWWTPTGQCRNKHRETLLQDLRIVRLLWCHTSWDTVEKRQRVVLSTIQSMEWISSWDTVVVEHSRPLNSLDIRCLECLLLHYIERWWTGVYGRWWDSLYLIRESYAFDYWSVIHPKSTANSKHIKEEKINLSLSPIEILFIIYLIVTLLYDWSDCYNPGNTRQTWFTNEKRSGGAYQQCANVRPVWPQVTMEKGRMLRYSILHLNQYPVSGTLSEKALLQFTKKKKKTGALLNWLKCL